MWSIGGLRIDGRVVLGPMSGYTSAAYREFMRPFGAAVSVTEMVSDMGLIYGADRTVDRFVKYGRTYPTGMQLFGSDPERLANAASIALRMNPQIDFFDINMGCPARKVTRNGSGSALLKDPAKCGEMVRAVRRAADVPVTAKIRLGWSSGSMDFREVISELEDAGASAIALHARTRDERYAGTPHYDLVEGLQKEMSVPLVISGNIYTAEDARKALGVTGAEAVMVARGGIGNPFLITQIDQMLRTGDIPPHPTVARQADWCVELCDALISELGEETAMKRMRSIAPRFFAGCYRGRELRKRLAFAVKTRDDLVGIVGEIRDALGTERIYCDGRKVYGDEDTVD